VPPGPLYSKYALGEGQLLQQMVKLKLRQPLVRWMALGAAAAAGAVKQVMGQPWPQLAHLQTGSLQGRLFIDLHTLNVSCRMP